MFHCKQTEGGHFYMSQIGFSQARTGRRASGSNFTGVETLSYEPGEKKRVVVPLKKDEDGKAQLVLFGETVHRINDKNTIRLPKKKGGTYSVHTFRCTHPYNQQTFDKQVEMAERKEMCPLCEFERLQNQQRMKMMEEEFGSFEAFKELSKKEKKEFYQRHPISVEASYYEKDGQNRQQTEMFLLLLEIVTEIKTKRVKVKSTGKVKELTEQVPKVDEDGNVEFKPIFFKASGKRLGDLKDAVDNAINSETITFDMLHPYIENEGTEFEEEVNIGWVDFEFAYPEKEGDQARMESARDMKIFAVKEEKSVFTQHENFLEQAEAKMDTYYNDASSTFGKVFQNLKPYTREEMLSFFTEEARNLFFQLRDEFRNEKTEEAEQKVYETVLNQAAKNSEEEDTTETTAEATKEEKKVDKKQETKKEVSKKQTEITDEAEIEEDIELDEEFFEE